ncbi:MAG: sensor histidine kinase [Bacteroidales bacterium]
MNRLKEKSSKNFVVWSSFIISLLANLPIMDMALKRNGEMHIKHPAHEVFNPIVLFADMFTQLLISFIFAYLLISFLQKNKWSAKLNMLSFWKTLSVTILLYSSFIGLLIFLSSFFVDNILFVISSVVTRGILILIASVFLSNYIKIQEHRKQIFIDNALLKQQNLNSQIEVLKNQLNPHFFFNALNTLSWLIEENKEKSQIYLNKLSYLLRSSIEMQKNILVPLATELELADAYMHLLNIRFGDKIIYKKNIINTLGFEIPPMSLQTLLENAIKHNIISEEFPLTISIIQSDDLAFINVINNYMIKKGTQGNGIGLQNLTERFKAISSNDIKIKCDKKTFEVVLPLIAKK